MCWNPQGIFLKSLNHAILKSWVFICQVFMDSLGVIPFNLAKYYKIILCSYSYEGTTFLPQLFEVFAGFGPPHKDLKSHTHTSWVQVGGTRLVVLSRGIFPVSRMPPIEYLLGTFGGHWKHSWKQWWQVTLSCLINFAVEARWIFVAKSWIVDRLGV